MAKPMKGQEQLPRIKLSIWLVHQAAHRCRKVVSKANVIYVAKSTNAGKWIPCFIVDELGPIIKHFQVLSERRGIAIQILWKPTIVVTSAEPRVSTLACHSSKGITDLQFNRFA